MRSFIFFTLLLGALISNAQNVTVSANNNNQCAPMQVTFTGTAPTNAFYYNWSYYDYNQQIWISNNTSTNTFTTSFNNPGTNTYFYLDVYDADWGYLGSDVVNIITKGSTPSIYSSLLTFCPNSEVTFWTYNSAPGYTWNFGDGNVVSSPNNSVTHQYSTTGVYNVKVIYPDGCGSQDTASLQVTVANNLNSPVQISANTNSVCPGGTISFSSGFTANSYFWDFGDGETSSGTFNVQHTFNTSGNYDVKLVTTNGCEISDSITFSVNVNSNTGFSPSSQINSKDQICPGERFYMSTEYGYKSYLYDFGNGYSYTSVESNSNSYIYNTPGIYNIGITITNFCGNDTTIRKDIEVTNSIHPGTQYFGVGNLNQTCPGSSIRFDAYGDITKSIWNMGDGTIDTVFNNIYEYTYLTQGIKNISVKMTNYCGLDTLVYTSVDVNPNTPIENASSYVSPNKICPGEPISFNVSASSDNSYFIVFSSNPTDTIFSNYAARSSFYTPGTYTAYFGIKNLCGKDTIIQKTFMVTNNKPVNPWVSLPSNDVICSGSSYEICSPYGNKNYSWDFGNGKTGFSSGSKCFTENYNNAGNYTITLSFENLCGSDTTLSTVLKVVNSKPLDPFTLYSKPTSCPGDQWNANISISQNDRSSCTYSWDFGDGNTLFTQKTNISHVFTNVGTYNVTLTINNSCGPGAVINTQVNVGLNDEIDPYDIWANVSDEISCPGTLLNFNSTDGYKKYFWKFSNGDTLTTQTSEITKTFNTAGAYKLTLTLFNGCNKSANKSINFTVSNNAQLDPITFENTGTVACPGDNVLIIGDKEGGDAGITYNWEFGDSQTGTTYNSSTYHTYNVAGTYTVNVSAHNTCGDTTYGQTEVSIINNSQPEFVRFNGGSPIFIPNYDGTSAGCPGDAITFLYVGEFKTNLYNFGDGTSGSSNSFITVAGFKYHTITHIYDAPGSYWVYLTVSNACGNSITDSLLVKISNTTSENTVDVFAIPSKKPEGYSTCTPVEFILFGSKTYQVDFGDGTISTTSSPSLRHSYPNAGFYHVTISGTNGCGYTSSASTDVIVNEGGTLTASVIPTPPSCYNGANGSISLNIQDGFPPYNFEWQNFNTNSNTLNGIRAGTYYVTVSDSVGCIKDLDIVLNDAPQIILTSSSVTKPDCQTSNGAISVIATNGNGSYQYIWDNGTPGNTISGIPSGVYSVSVSDGIGCQNTASFSLMDKNSPIISVDSSFSLLKVCKGGSDANVEINVTGGTQPYSYSWSNGSSAPNQSNLSEGVYSLEVGDNSGCRSNAQIRIEAYPSIITNINVTRKPDCKQFNGEISFTVSGGSNSFELSLDGNVLTGTSANGLNAGKHTLIITDLNSFCSEDTIFYLDNAGTLDFSVTRKNPKCFGTTDGLISISPSGGTPSYYSMVTSTVYNSPKSTKTLFNNLSEANYRIQIEDKVGCIVNKIISLDAPDSLSTSFNTLSAYCGNNNGSITGLINGGTKPFTIALSGQTSQVGNSYNFNNLAGGNYTLTITDSNFCQKSKLIPIQTQVSNILGNITTNPSVCGKPQGSAQTNVSGGYPPYSYSWSNGASGNSISNLTPGIYSLTITDNRACSVTENFGIDTLIVLPGICLITVDSATEKNLLMWEKTPGSNIQSYNVYREGSVQNQFNLIANVPVNQLSEYLDPNSNTRVQSYRYKISAIDSCGNESELSDFHKTIHLLISQGTGNNWNLEWYNYQGLPIPSYSIWRSSDSINYSLINTMAASIDPQSNTYTDITAPAGDVYYIVSFEAPTECNSDLNRVGKTNSIFRTQKRVKSNVGSNRMANPTALSSNTESSFEIYPNPNNGQFTIEFKNEIVNANIKITNQLGQVIQNIKTDEIKENRIKVNFANFDTGVYFIHFVSENTSITKRIIKF